MVGTVEQVLAEVNAHHGSDWRLRSRLAGGFQSGAYLLDDGLGGSAVLKWSTDPTWAPVVLAAAPVVAAARASGWPTPAWLAVGCTAVGLPYQVQEYVVGSTEDRVTHEWLDLVLPVVDGHAGRGTEVMRDWSRYDREVVLGTHDRARRLLRTSGQAGERVVEAITTSAARHPDAVPSSTDLVHGDLNPENVLVRDDSVVALVDVEALGRGSRVHDLSTLVLQAALWGERETLERLIAACRASAQPGWFEISLGSVALDQLVWGVEHWPGTDLRAACLATQTLIEELFLT